MPETNSAGRAYASMHRQAFAQSTRQFSWDILAPRTPLLGELAISKGFITEETLDKLLDRQWRCCWRLGELLVSEGHIRPGELTRLLALQHELPYIDISINFPDITLQNARHLDFYAQRQCIPWRLRDGELTYVAVDPTAARPFITALEGRPCFIYFASPRQIRQFIHDRFHIELSERARSGLSEDMPESSARTQLSRPQCIVLMACFFLLCALSFFTPATAMLLLNGFFAACFLAIAGLKALSVYFGLRQRGREDRDMPPPDSNDALLPLYSIMVPLFREARVLPILADALRNLDYPASRLQIILIFEESDQPTYDAACALGLPGHFEFIRVPPSLPLTKPKACNFALPFVRGEFVVVYDAEDMPEPDQLRRANAAFDRSDDRLACIQARLNYYNQFENWLTRQFTLEYASFFDLLLPTLEALGLPIPLGGTSTHFRTSHLRSAGAWDPFNVTEDADLGMRLAMLGYRVSTLRSTTFEEANCQTSNWLRQRSRWIKGWLQTYFVRMRHPVHLWRTLGWRGFLGFQIVIGGFSLSSLVHPVFYATIIGALAYMQITQSGSVSQSLGTLPGLVVLNLMVLFTGYSVSILAGMVAATERGLRPLVFSAFAMPAYWLLISLGAYKALWQFIYNPFHWEKTEHGLSRFWAQKHAAALRSNAAKSLKNKRFS